MRILIGILAAVAAAGAIWFLARDLMPPKALSFAAGGQGGGYWAFAERYRDALARDEIDVALIETGGSVRNADLLAAGTADVALVQGGVSVPDGMESLGAVFYEPMMFFARRDAALPRNPARWQGLRIARGGAGSGTAAAFARFAHVAGLGDGGIVEVARGGEAAAGALLAGEVDIAVFVAPISAGYLRPLFSDPRIGLIALDHATAIARGMSQTEVIAMPSGGISLDPVLPREEIELLGMIAHLVAREDLHPSLVNRLVEAARRLHAAPDALTPARRFPSSRDSALEMDPYAMELIREGPSPLHAYLPYWVVAQINRFAILLVPVLIFLIPLLRALPGIYAWRMRWRVSRHYPEIREIDIAARQARDAETLSGLLGRLERISGEITALSLPPVYRHRAYTAHQHIRLVRQTIEDRLRDVSDPADPVG